MLSINDGQSPSNKKEQTITKPWKGVIQVWENHSWKIIIILCLAQPLIHHSVEIVINYIVNKWEHHGKKTFQDEYKAFLKKYEVEYDERYVWD